MTNVSTVVAYGLREALRRKVFAIVLYCLAAYFLLR